MRPMPLQLADVADERPRPPEPPRGLRSGSRLALRRQQCSPSPERSGYFDGPVHARADAWPGRAGERASPWVDRHSTLDSLPDRSVTETGLLDPWPVSHGRCPDKRTRPAAAKATAGTALPRPRRFEDTAHEEARPPLTSLGWRANSRLKPAGDHRETVLAELERTAAKFSPGMPDLATALIALDDKSAGAPARSRNGRPASDFGPPTLFR